MFTYDDRDSLLREVNPVIKLILIIAITVLVSLSFYPVLPLATIFAIVLGLIVLGRFRLREIVYQARLFIFICLGFIVLLLVTRGLVGPGEYRLAFFRFEYDDFIYAFSLGLRIMVLALLSLAFVLTTDPNDLVLSMMLQLRLPYVHGYAALAAYRFIPTFSREIQKIQLAQTIRGVQDDRGVINKLKRPFKLFLPLLATAIRRGERVSMAMESRALGAYPTRTFYRKTLIKKSDLLFLIGTIIVFALIVVALITFNLFRFNVGFN